MHTPLKAIRPKILAQSLIVYSREKMREENSKSLTCWFNQIGLVLTIIMGLLTKFARLDDPNLQESMQDMVLINFPRRAAVNGTTRTVRHMYLPPEEEPDFVLPEVIDNRLRHANIKSTAIPIGTGLLPLELTSVPHRHSTPEFFYKETPGVNIKYPKNSDNSRIMKIISMSCRNDRADQVFFRASIALSQNYEQPIVEGAISDLCKIKRINDEYRLDFTNELFWNCGVQDCSTDVAKFYCLNLRFPVIAGLWLKEDTKIILRCRTQEKITSHTKRINLKTLDTSARMVPRIATGGHKNTFETEVGLYRKALGSDNLFDAKIQPGGTVVLGEEILLRIVVRDGDGWKYSKISDVSVHYVNEDNKRKKIMNSLWILDSNGCLNPGVKKISSREQYRVSPLETFLVFEAFMFDSMKETDEMVMSIKVTGCLDGNDCILNCPGGHSRKTRSLENSRNQTVNLLDDISFRVTFPKSRDVGGAAGDINHRHIIIPYTILFAFVVIAVATLLCAVNVLRKQQRVQIF